MPNDVTDFSITSKNNLLDTYSINLGWLNSSNIESVLSPFNTPLINGEIPDNQKEPLINSAPFDNLSPSITDSPSEGLLCLGTVSNLGNLTDAVHNHFYDLLV